MNKDDTDITVRILPIEQAHLEIELKVFESLLKTMNYSTMFTYSGIAGELELDVNKLTQHLTNKITELKTELENYKNKAPITKPASSVNTVKYSW